MIMYKELDLFPEDDKGIDEEGAPDLSLPF